MAKEVKCPWCGGVVEESEIKLTNGKNAFGTIVERRCPKCGKILAAYRGEEGNFLPRTRKF